MADIYVDNDISAYSGKHRPQYERLCDDIKSGTVDAVIAWHPDRLHRRPVELEDFINLLEAHRVEVHTCTAGFWDLSNPSGRFVARSLGAVARYESEHKSERIRRKMVERAQQGKVPGGGTRPYGYTRERQVIEAEAAMLREAARRVLAGEALYSVCTDFNDRGVTSSTGRPWVTSVMRRMLMSARLSGQREHRGELVGPAAWDAIITPAETARLQALLSDPARRTSRSARRYPLKGLLFCGVCGTKLVSRPTGDGRRQYGCISGTNFSGCGKIRIVADPLEQLIADAVLYRLDTPALHRVVMDALAQDARTEGLQDDLATMTADLENLARAHGEGEITWAEYLAARKPLGERMADAKKKLGRLSRHSALEGFVGNSEALRSQWADLAPARQRAIIDALVDTVSVHPANRHNPRFDPDRVKVIWRA
jgi:site-specific DNA recombinase